MNQPNVPLQSPTPTAASSQVTPTMLIAAPGLRDPMFAHTVILLVEAGPQGAYGMVVNRPAPVDLGALLDGAGIPHQDLPAHTVWLGGPVAPQSGLVVYVDEPGLQVGKDYEPQADLLPGLRMSSSLHLLRDIAQGGGPTRYALFLGRASWTPGQLEAELSAGIWLPTELDPSLLFTHDPEDTWRRALSNMGTDPSHVMAGSAEA